MRRAVSVVGVLMIVVGVAFAVLSLLTYANQDERHEVEHRLYDLQLSPESEARAREDLRSIQDREWLNIQVAIGGTVAAVAGGAMVRAARRRPPAVPSPSR
ncbi:hypothetical protein [Streptomyces canus]|uniref:Aromatic ring-opening dioxygenase LigA n=1 Tax=Streptomyces canus TaxID=58343 RepID=A0AAW8FEY1_9ACTN|nr:hypothetical protein [Streptomyces canus]MDQ0762857.1 hypothetical protein [Streptomyces canus]MDQ0908686.1 hypothetical protein [Streptomyces canus]MDQ1068685.1 hypothetical protein [Streptomyces canus]